MTGFETLNANYIRELALEGRRVDGRGPSDYRKVSVRPDGIESAEGSAEVDLGGTRVLASVSMQVEPPMRDTPKLGSLTVSAELLPLAHRDFEEGPPSPESVELARVVDRGIRAGNCANLEKLFIDEGKAWGLYVDIYVLNHDGNLFDASSLAAMAALATARVPGYENGAADYMSRGRRLDLNSIVTTSTFAKVGGKLLLDPDIGEEGSASARLTVATDGNRIKAMQKGLPGGITSKEVDEMAEVSLSKHKEMRKEVERLLS